jgi:hypothetical protein
MIVPFVLLLGLILSGIVLPFLALMAIKKYPSLNNAVDYIRHAVVAGVGMSLGIVLLTAILLVYGIESNVTVFAGLGVAWFNYLILKDQFGAKFHFIASQIPATFALCFTPGLPVVAMTIGVLLGNTLAFFIFSSFMAAFRVEPTEKAKREYPLIAANNRLQSSEFKWIEMKKASDDVEQYVADIADTHSPVKGYGTK